MALRLCNSHVLKIVLLCSIWPLVFCNDLDIVVKSVRVVNENSSTDKNWTYVRATLLIDGDNFPTNMKIKLTPEVEEDDDDEVNRCIGHQDSESHIIREFASSNSTFLSVNVSFSSYNFDIPVTNFSLCVLINLPNSDNESYFDKWLYSGKSVQFRTRRLLSEQGVDVDDLDNHILPAKSERIRRDVDASSNVTIYGVLLESSTPPALYDDDGGGEPTLLVGSEATYRLFGSGWTEDTIFVWTEQTGEYGSECEYITGDKTKPILETGSEHTATLKMTVPGPQKGKSEATLYFCYKSSNSSDKKFLHLGDKPFGRIVIRERIIPLWLQVIIIVVCLSFSCLFSGLNLGLLSLNRTDLKIISNTGTENERKYAKAIYPVRIHGNYLLCSILLGNVLVNSIFTILLDDLSSGMVAIVVSTLAIVICGEICPQAVCSRHGLAIGARTIYITKTVMFLTAPLSWPLSRLLDWVLGEEIATTYTRERLKELVKITNEYNDLEKDEVNIISGALELRKKTVGEVMTKIEDVYMLSYDTILDFETVSEIMKSGFSRIPVYESTRRNIVSLLYIKDLALIDPDDCTPLKTLSQFYQNSCYYVFEDTTLDVVFKQFKDGCKGHMAFVHRVNNEGEGDPFYETVGIVTLEDVIEELIQAEIMDETDVYTDNRSKQRRSERMHHNADFSLFSERNMNQRVHISPQLNYAAFQFLHTSVDAFKPENISESVLLRLLKQDIIFHIKVKDKEKMKDDPSCVIYQQGKQTDYFVLILEGRVEVTVGRENLMFESGPFTYFGSQALIPNIGVAESPTNTNVAQPLGSLQSVNLESMLRYTFIPDYTVRAVSEVFYLRIKRSFYLAAKKATLMERSKKVSNAGEHFDDEVEKLLHNFGKGGSGDDDSKSQESRDGSFPNTQNLQYIEDSNRSSPVNQDSLNNGYMSGTVSPSRTPRHTSDLTGEEKTNLLSVQASTNNEDAQGTS